MDSFQRTLRQRKLFVEDGWRSFSDCSEILMLTEGVNNVKKRKSRNTVAHYLELEFRACPLVFLESFLKWNLRGI